MNKRLERALIAAVVAGAMIAGGHAKAGDRLAMLTVGEDNMSVGRVTSAPIGYIQFCAQNPADCGAGPGKSGKVALTSANLAQLDEVNRSVNRRIQPMTDLEHFGEIERWSYPDDGFGDCEDYVLLKRRTLIGLGWPADTLLITVVRDQRGDGHSVLTVVTDHGDVVLDNQEDDILAWHETGYRYVKRQSQSNLNVWVSLGDVRAPATVGRN
ncbi:transglutaminase-like cysteine peptidase [Ancylobacter terrae]|uniref:transglutaminase-like cysteine peptidase n=1 Tax=Ancylobacter sp. sgz301288 TaxID=3342077 RepID=UPI0038580E05